MKKNEVFFIIIGVLLLVAGEVVVFFVLGGHYAPFSIQRIQIGLGLLGIALGGVFIGCSIDKDGE